MRLSLERKLVAGVLVLVLVPTLVVGAILFAMYRAEALAAPSGMIATAVVSLVALMGYLGLVVYGLGRSLIRRLREIQLGTELMASVNPTHRLQVRTGDELAAVAAEINRMADRLHEARVGLEAEVARATRLVEVERGKLSAVLESLGEGVAVASLDGLIILANPTAHELLRASSSGLLGRSLFDFVDREKVAHFLQRLRAGVGMGVERFSLPAAADTIIEAVMTPFFDGEELIGFVLVFRDVTRPARSDEERYHRLAQVVRDLRGPLTSIRSLSESLLGDPTSVAGPGRRLLEAIHAEALRLSGLVTATAAPARLGLADAPRYFEEITVADLLAMAVRRLGSEGGGQIVSVNAEGPVLPSLRAEASALTGALAHLLGVVLERRQPGASAWLRPRPYGRALQIEAGAEGTGRVADLETLLDVPIPVGASGRLTVHEIIRRHAGEVWAYAEAGRLGFRLTLPVEEESPLPDGDPPETIARPGFVGAGLRSGFSADEPAPARPDFYDFSLFEAMERHVPPADRERALEELTCVVFDTETTGLQPQDGDAIVSIAAVRVRAGAVKRGEVFDALVDPGRPIPASSTRFHGLTDDVVAGAPPIDVVLPAFLRFAENTVLVGHQVWFDVRFLDIAAARFGARLLTHRHAVLDTLTLSEVVHGPLDGHGLDTIARRLGVAVRGRHSALGDAYVTAEIFVRLLELLKKRGIRTLGQALEAARHARRFGAPPSATGLRP